MAHRPVFMSISKKESRVCTQTNIEFTYFNGFAKTQKQKCIYSLHENFSMEYPGKKILDISRYSTDPLGVRLSAFNMLVPLSDGRKVPLECAFQAGKVFERGGPYTDLLDASAKDAKTDPRLKNSGQIVGFRFDGQEFPTVPKTLFYNWLYVNALNDSPELAEQIMEYDAFSDIVFNPEKSINCQAEAAAYFVSLKKLGVLDEALKDINSFLTIAYKQQGVAELAKSLPKEDMTMGIPVILTDKPEQDIDNGKQETIPATENLFEVGDEIRHPRFGTGQVVNIAASGKVEVVFPGVGNKILSAKWLSDNLS